MWYFLRYWWSKFWQYSIFLFIRHDTVLIHVKWVIDKICYWFTKKILKENVDKCHLTTSSKTPLEIEVSSITVMSEENVKLLEIRKDSYYFEYHVSTFCKEAGKKFHALTAVFKYMDTWQRKLVTNISVLILSFNLDVSQRSYRTHNK